MKEIVNTIPFEEYKAEIGLTQDTEGNSLFYVCYYWKGIFIHYTPANQVTKERMEEYALKKMKRFDCAEIDADRYSFQGNVYYLLNYKENDICLL